MLAVKLVELLTGRDFLMVQEGWLGVSTPQCRDAQMFNLLRKNSRKIFLKKIVDQQG